MDTNGPRTWLPRSLVVAIGVLGVLALVATACGGPGGSSGSGGSGTPDGLDGAWRLTAGSGPDGEVHVPDQPTVTLTIDGTRWRGDAHCNIYDATVATDGATIDVGDMAVTERGCLDQVLQEAEGRYLAALRASTSVTVDGDTLTLEGEGIRLVYARVPPIEDAPLVGTSWRLDSLVLGAGDDGAVAQAAGDGSLVLADDGTLSGSNGCNHLSGRYALDGTRLRVDELASTLRGCAPPLDEQERHVNAVLDGQPEATVDGDRLSLQTGDGLGLRYVAEPVEDAAS